MFTKQNTKKNKNYFTLFRLLNLSGNSSITSLRLPLKIQRVFAPTKGSHGRLSKEVSYP